MEINYKNKKLNNISCNIFYTEMGNNIPKNLIQRLLWLKDHSFWRS